MGILFTLEDHLQRFLYCTKAGPKMEIGKNRYFHILFLREKK